MRNWESLIAQRQEAHRDTYKPQRIEEPGKQYFVISWEVA